MGEVEVWGRVDCAVVLREGVVGMRVKAVHGVEMRRGWPLFLWKIVEKSGIL